MLSTQTKIIGFAVGVAIGAGLIAIGRTFIGAVIIVFLCVWPFAKLFFDPTPDPEREEHRRRRQEARTRRVEAEAATSEAKLKAVEEKLIAGPGEKLGGNGGTRPGNWPPDTP